MVTSMPAERGSAASVLRISARSPGSMPGLPGESTAGITDWDKLPPAARAYLRALEELAGCPLSIVSTGPDRDANIILRDPWA